MSDFDREIERELDRALRPPDSSSIPAWRAPASRGAIKRILGGAGVALGAKLLTGFAVAALAAAGATAATEAGITGSLNPNDWGQQVVQQVSKCKAALQPGQHGIGQCVSAFATQHGPTVSADHRASPGRTNPGKGNDKSNNGKGDGHGNNSSGDGKPSYEGHGHNGSGDGQPSDKGHGKPTPQTGSDLARERLS